MTQYCQDLIPVSKWNNYYDYPTVGALRQLIFYDKDSFKDRVIRRINKRLYIKASEFFMWVEENQQKGGI